MSDGEEYNNYNTNPNKKDTDGDYLTDYEEITNYPTDPTTQDSEGVLLWKKKVVGTFDEFAGVTAQSGTVYVVGKTMDNAPVTALNAGTGEIIWQTPVGSCDSTPTLSNGKLFVINCMWDDMKVKKVTQPYPEERVWCLNKSTGEVIWSNKNVYPDGAEVYPAPENGLVYTASTKDAYAENPLSKVYAFDIETGEKVWESSYQGVTMGVKMIKNQVVVSGTTNLSSYNATTGELIWHNSKIECWDSNPVLYNDKIFIGGGRGGPTSIYVVSPEGGDVLWKWSAENNLGTTLTSPTIKNGDIYFGGSGKLFCLNLTEKSLVWKDEGNGYGPYSTPVIQEGNVYYGTTLYGKGSKDKIITANTTTGEMIWNHSINTTLLYQGVYSQPTIYKGRLYITSDDGYLRCFSIRGQLPK